MERMTDKRAIDPLDLLTGLADNALFDIYAATIADEMLAEGLVELAQIWLLDWDGLTDDEIGSKIGIHRHTVRKRKRLVAEWLERRKQ